MRKLNCFICNHCRNVLWATSSAPAWAEIRARHYCSDAAKPDCRSAQDDVWDKEPNAVDIASEAIRLIADNATDPEPESTPPIDTDWSGGGGESGGGGASSSWDSGDSGGDSGGGDD